MLKRSFDVIIALVAIIILAPILVTLAVLVRVKLGAPIFFKQYRPGLNEQTFAMLKFRTMTDGRDESGNLLPDNERLVPFGSFLRRTSLDELPELFNILKGDMSLVGPRPLLHEYLPYYTAREKLRHTVRPGLTGLAQVSGRNNLRWEERLAKDVEYVEQGSFWLDLKILALTALKVVKSEDVVVVPSSIFGKLSDIRASEQRFNQNIQSPLQFAPELGADLGCSLWLKRDDLIAEYLGGNKVRKNIAILKAICEKAERPDVIITNGGAHSNHARVCALLARRYGIDCHLVMHGEEPLSDFLHGNYYFVKLAGAKAEFVEATEIRKTIERRVREYEKQGLRVEVIPGGAHSLEGAMAYVEAVDELSNQLPEELSTGPDYIVVASGTGATQAGIAAGVELKGWHTKVIGISVARQNPRGNDAVVEVYEPLLKVLGHDSYSRIIFKDDYTFGGYAMYNAPLTQSLQHWSAVSGIPFDPCYTGKALYGLGDLIEKGEIVRGSKVVFWHTGGLLNLQTSSSVKDLT